MKDSEYLLLFGSAGNDLLRLFRNGEDGFLFYPMSDLTRLFLLSTGATGNAASDADPVGLDLDNHSWGGGVALTAVLASATELLIAGSWTMGVAGGTSTATESPAGTLNLTGDGTNAARGDQSFTTVVGKTYRIAATVGTNTCTVQAGTSQGDTTNLAATTLSVAATPFVSFVATATTTWIRFSRTTAGLSAVSAISCKLVPGNHAIQATTTKRPLWKANSGKPYLIGDGTDDVLTSPFVPTAACTIAFAGNFDPTDGSGSSVLMGGGGTTGSHRLNVGCSASGIVGFGWGADNLTVATAPGLGDIRGQDHVYVVTGDAVTVDFWVDNAVAHTRAANGSPAGGTGGLSFCCYNNAGAPGNFSKGRIYAGLALNRRVTPAEIALITSQFRSAYQ